MDGCLITTKRVPREYPEDNKVGRWKRLRSLMIQLNLWINQSRNQSKSGLLVTWSNKCPSCWRHLSWVFCYLQPKAFNWNRPWSQLLLAASHTCIYTCMYTHVYNCFGLGPCISHSHQTPLLPQTTWCLVLSPRGLKACAPFTRSCFLETECPCILGEKGLKKEEALFGLGIYFV